MIKENFDNNGYEYVDLGLPSGTLWATCNVGADKPTDFGLYFHWGDTKGYSKDQVGTGDGKKKFADDWSDYKFGVTPNFTKYNAYGATLELVDDAANANMGGDWHMPTPKQVLELIDNTTTTWTTLDDVNGRLFTSKKDSSKSIFIPAAGYACDGSVKGIGDEGDVWSSMLGTGYASNGYDLNFFSDNANLFDDGRGFGLSVRGVIDKKHDNSK